MFQIVEAFVNTLSKLLEDHGSKVVIGALVLVGSGIVLKVLHRILSGRGPGQV